MAVTLLLSVIVLYSVLQPSFGAVRTRNTLYGSWTTPTSIFYQLGAGYTAADTSNIQAAMAQISTDMNNCIRFVPYVAGVNTGQDFIQISQTLANPTSTTAVSTATCFSFPGRVVSQAGRGQTLLMVTGADGCLASIRDIMKYLVHALGLRDEMNRSDRDTYLQVVPNTSLKPALVNLGITTTYAAANSDLLTTNFDYKSVTIPPINKYVNTGVLYNLVGGVAVPTTGNTAIGTLARLSQGDCLGLRFIYGASCVAQTVTCADPYGGTGASTLNTNLAATVTPTGTIVTGTAGAAGAPLEPPTAGGITL